MLFPPSESQSSIARSSRFVKLTFLFKAEADGAAVEVLAEGVRGLEIERVEGVRVLESEREEGVRGLESDRDEVLGAGVV